MKFDCPRKEFLEAISAAGAAAAVRTSVQLLQYLKIEAEDGFVRIVGCDGEMWVIREVPCLVSEPGALCLLAKTLVDIVSQLPDGDLTIFTLPSGGAMLKQGASEYRMNTLDPQDFPEPPGFGGEGELKLPMGDLRKAVDSVLYAVSTDPHRQLLTGVLFSYDGAMLTLVATDTHRLAVRKISQPGIGSNITSIVPEKALRSIKSIPMPDDETVTLQFGGGRIGVDAGSARVVAQLLSGTYPNWERVVPSEFTRSWLVEVDQLQEKVKRAMIFARENQNRIKLRGTEDQIILSARSEERGEAKEEVPMVAENGEIEIAFNGKYVTDVLSAIHGPGVRVEMTENSRAAVFRAADDDAGYICVIMPMAPG